MTATAVQPSAFEVRYDAVVTRMRHLAKVVGGGSIGNELRDILDEMVRIRRDMADRPADEVMAAPLVVDEPERRPYRTRGTATPVRSENPLGRNGAARRGTQKVHGRFIRLAPGRRWCAAHDDGDGKMLTEADFKVKNPKTGAMTSWCVACTSRYQQERYVRVGYKRVVAEVREGDACVGHDCPVCGLPFEIGERVSGDNVRHEGCADG